MIPKPNGMPIPELGTVDSRAYAYAYLIGRTGDVPKDFPAAVVERFSVGLFLPQELAGRFKEPAYPARVLLLSENEAELTLHIHPTRGEPPSRIAMCDVRVVNQNRFLLDCRFGFDLAARAEIGRKISRSCDIQHNGRDSDAVGMFLRQLRSHLLLPTCADPGSLATIHFGDPLSFKFAGYEQEELVEGEVVHARLFIAEQEKRERRWLGSVGSWTPADYLAITNRRLIWMTDRDGGYRQPFGVRCSFSPIMFLYNLNLQDDGWLHVFLANDIDWRLRLPSGHKSAAREFIKEGQLYHSH